METRFNQQQHTWRKKVEYATVEVIRKGFSCKGKMDDKMRLELCEGLAELSAEVVEQSSPIVREEWQREASGEVLFNGQLFLECAQEKDFPLSDLQALLKRQTEVARAVADQEQSSWKMLQMVSNLTKVIADQEHCIFTLQQERAGAERMAAEISVDLRTQYVEISKLKKRYDTAEEQLLTVTETVTALEAELKRRSKALIDKDAAIQELKQRLAEREKQDQVAQHGVAQKREDRDKRLAEIRSILSRSSDKSAQQTTPRAKLNPRLEALRAARDSRLQEIRGLLQKKNPSPTATTRPKSASASTTQRQYGDLTHNNSVSSTSEETMSDISSLDSSSHEGDERHRLYDALVRQRQNLREMS